MEVAVVNGTGGSAAVRYIHTDQLAGANIITNANDTIDETLDYYPYGSIRINSGTYNEQRKYIGQEYDTDTSLSYLNARYYGSIRGQFVSEDSMFWNFDKAWLADPQNQNSYAYARNNPIGLSDPTGKSIINYVPYNSSDGYYPYGSIQGTYYGVPIYSNGNDRSGQYQCPGFVKNFSQTKFDANLSGLGNGGQYSEQSRYDVKMVNQIGSFTVYQNGGSELPKENDIMSWTSSIGGYGHVGVVVQVYFDSEKGSGTLLTTEQNQSARSGIFSQNITSKTVNGITNYTIQSKNPSSTNIPTAFARYTNFSNPSSSSINQSTNLGSKIINKIKGLFK